MLRLNSVVLQVRSDQLPSLHVQTFCGPADSACLSVNGLTTFMVAEEVMYVNQNSGFVQAPSTSVRAECRALWIVLQDFIKPQRYPQNSLLLRHQMRLGCMSILQGASLDKDYQWPSL